MKLYKHDCEQCFYYGSTKELDFYICKDTVIARYGDIPSDYYSASFPFIDKNISHDEKILQFLKHCPACIFNLIERR